MDATRYERISTALLLTALGAWSAPALAEEGSIKVECNGGCESVTLGQVCDRYRTGSRPISVACDQIQTPAQSGVFPPCGGNWATCTTNGAMFRSDALAFHCADGGGNDALVTCTTAPTSQGAVGAVEIECWGFCDKVTMPQACQPLAGSVPVGVACNETSNTVLLASHRKPCGNGATCAVMGTLSDVFETLQMYCDDGGGNDAIVFCR